MDPHSSCHLVQGAAIWVADFKGERLSWMGPL